MQTERAPHPATWYCCRCDAPGRSQAICEGCGARAARSRFAVRSLLLVPEVRAAAGAKVQAPGPAAILGLGIAAAEAAEAVRDSVFAAFEGVAVHPHGRVRQLLEPVVVRTYGMPDWLARQTLGEVGTRTHAEHVMLVALVLADRLGLTLQQRRQVALGALLHDVGGHVLEHGDIYAHDEVTGHAEVGAQVLGRLWPQLPWLEEPTIQAVRLHHHDLRDLEEPVYLAARLVAAADQVDATLGVRDVWDGAPLDQALVGLEHDPRIEPRFGRMFAYLSGK